MSSNSEHPLGLRPPPPPTRGPQERAQSYASQRSTSSLSTTSNDSQTAAQTAVKRLPAAPLPSFTMPSRPSTAANFNPPPNNASQTNFSRPAPSRGPHDEPPRIQRSNAMSSVTNLGHRRQHSQGFFEPSLPTASASSMSASAIAAAAAMSHLGPPSHQPHERKRSISGLSAIAAASSPARAAAVSPSRTSPPPNNPGYLGFPSPQEGRAAATTAAYAAFPKSPNMETASIPPLPPVVPEKETKPKEKSKMKLFSKPKVVTTSKDADKKLPTLPSPVKRDLISVFPNLSTTSLAESSTSGSNSLYSSANQSTSTLTPAVTTSMGPPPPPSATDKHRPHFLSRQKLRHGDKGLTLSSASSNSQAVDPSAPSSLYSFVPQSPGVNSTFSKSVTGLDLRHGGKGLRDRRKEEKAAASLGIAMPGSTLNLTADHRSEFLGPSSMESHGPSSAQSANSVFHFDQNPSASAVAFNNLGANMGLSGITPDDAWPLLKARLLAVFEGEDVRTPVEDFNLLVSVHVRRCVQKRAPHVLVEDLREFLQTGFTSLSQTLKLTPEERLIPSLVEMWQMVYCRVLPFILAVFLPLDLEFRGSGTIMTAKEAQDFWGGIQGTPRVENSRQSSELTITKPLSKSNELDVRRMVLASFRDIVIMARHDTLLGIFSRLSLDNMTSVPSEAVTVRSRGISNPVTDRPSTAGGSLSPRLSSYNSQSSTLADTTSSPSIGGFSAGRSRATSSVSAGSFGTSLPHLPSPLQQTHHSRTRSATTNNAMQPELPPPTDYGAGNLTDTVARMLQCVSILASLQTKDKGQAATEQLTGALKHNWLGRGRMGRQRKGFVGTRVATVVGGASA